MYWPGLIVVAFTDFRVNIFNYNEKNENFVLNWCLCPWSMYHWGFVTQKCWRSVVITRIREELVDVNRELLWRSVDIVWIEVVFFPLWCCNAFNFICADLLLNLQWKMVAFGKKLKDRQIEEWKGYVLFSVTAFFFICGC